LYAWYRTPHLSHTHHNPRRIHIHYLSVVFYAQCCWSCGRNYVPCPWASFPCHLSVNQNQCRQISPHCVRVYLVFAFYDLKATVDCHLSHVETCVPVGLYQNHLLPNLPPCLMLTGHLNCLAHPAPYWVRLSGRAFLTVLLLPSLLSVTL
jgi:hypothetical protein